MAAKVYSCPEGIDAPEFEDYLDGGFDSDGYFKAVETHRAKVAEWCKTNSDSAKLRGNVVGKCIAFGVADGKAEYMVYRHAPLSLIHLPYVDAYEAHPLMLKGLTLTEAKKMIRQDESIASLFGKSNRA